MRAIPIFNEYKSFVLVAAWWFSWKNEEKSVGGGPKKMTNETKQNVKRQLRSTTLIAWWRSMTMMIFVSFGPVQYRQRWWSWQWTTEFQLWDSFLLSPMSTWRALIMVEYRRDVAIARIDVDNGWQKNNINLSMIVWTAYGNNYDDRFIIFIIFPFPSSLLLLILGNKKRCTLVFFLPMYRFVDLTSSDNEI